MAKKARYALRFISGKYEGGEFPLEDGKEIIVGRSNDIDIVIVEDMVSRKHAKITVNGDNIVLEDLGSTNGTFVNGNKIKKTNLKVGDRIIFGTSILKLVELIPDEKEVDIDDDLEIVDNNEEEALIEDEQILEEEEIIDEIDDDMILEDEEIDEKKVAQSDAKSMDVEEELDVHEEEEEEEEELIEDVEDLIEEEELIEDSQESKKTDEKEVKKQKDIKEEKDHQKPSKPEPKLKMVKSGKKIPYKIDSGKKIMSGTLDELEIGDVLQMIGTMKKSGKLIIKSGDITGCIVLQKGILKSCYIEGSQASSEHDLYTLLDVQGGEFELLSFSADEKPEDIFNLSIEEAILNATKRKDELNNLFESFPELKNNLKMPHPLEPKLSDLSKDELDLFQEVINKGNVQTILTTKNVDEIELYKQVSHLIKKGYLIGE